MIKRIPSISKKMAVSFFIVGNSATYKIGHFPIITLELLDGRDVNMISYRPFWDTLKRKNISQYRLIMEYGFSTGTLDALRKNRSITLSTLHDICSILECDITDVVEFIEKE